MKTPRQVHLDDQMRAASRDAFGIFVASAHDGDRMHLGGIVDHIDWDASPLRQRMRDFFETKYPRCSHLRVPGSDAQVQMLMASMEPWQMRCARCAIRDIDVWRKQVVGTDEDCRCDLCGVVSPAGVRTLTGQLGPFIIWAGVCESCQGIEFAVMADEQTVGGIVRVVDPRSDQ